MLFFQEIFRNHFTISMSTNTFANMMMIIASNASRYSNNRSIGIATRISPSGISKLPRISLLLEIHSFDNDSFPTRKNTIPSNNAIPNQARSPPILFGKAIKENMLHTILAIIAFFRDILSQYFIIIISNTTTINSHIITYNLQFHNNSGITNHNNGRVIVVGIIHQKRSFLLDNPFFSCHNSSSILPFSRNIFAIINKANVSIMTVNNQ